MTLLQTSGGKDVNTQRKNGSGLNMCYVLMAVNTMLFFMFQ